MHKQHLWLLLLISAIIYWPFLSLFYYIAVAAIKSKQPLAKQQPLLKSLTEKSMSVGTLLCMQNYLQDIDIPL